MPLGPRGSFNHLTVHWSQVNLEPITTTAVLIEIEPQTTSYKAGEGGPPHAMFLDEDVERREPGVLEWRAGQGKG
jgi:hypothetical protein